jgi:hypothetical protein
MKKQQIQCMTPVLMFLLFCAAMALVQFSTPDLIDNDGFYHIKMAWLMRTQDLKPAFLWLPLTILNAREFYDHHFLFHAALMPFTFGNLVTGAKLAAVIFAGLAFLAVWHLFDQQKINYAWLWALGLLGVSEAFLYRMNIPRAQSLSLAVLALGMTWMLSGKHPLRLTALAFVYVWLYDAFPMLLALAVQYTLAVGMTERRLELRPLLYVSAGLILGMLINPYFPYNIIFAFRHMLPKLVDATSIRVGNEWYPYTTGQLLNNSLPVLVALASGIFALGLAGRRMELRTTLGLLVSLMFGLMLFQARRFIEYFPPFALVFVCFAWAPFFTETEAKDKWSKLVNKMPVAMLGVAVLAAGIFSLTGARTSMQGAKHVSLYAGSSAWLENNTPNGARVFQTDWDDFPRLFFYNTHNTYLIGLDPTYMQLANPKLYDIWVKVTQGKVENIAEVVAGKFGAKYIHSDLNHQGFIRKAEADAGLKEVYRDDEAVVFEVVR